MAFQAIDELIGALLSWYSRIQPQELHCMYILGNYQVVLGRAGYTLS